MKRDMRKYILRKLVELIFTLLFVTLLSFLLMRLSSVDPATAYAKRMIGNPTAEQIEKIRIQLGFDKPLLVQYSCYSGGVVLLPEWNDGAFHLPAYDSSIIYAL